MLWQVDRPPAYNIKTVSQLHDTQNKCPKLHGSLINIPDFFNDFYTNNYRWLPKMRETS